MTFLNPRLLRHSSPNLPAVLSLAFAERLSCESLGHCDHLIQTQIDSYVTCSFENPHCLKIELEQLCLAKKSIGTVVSCMLS